MKGLSGRSTLPVLRIAEQPPQAEKSLHRCSLQGQVGDLLVTHWSEEAFLRIPDTDRPPDAEVGLIPGGRFRIEIVD